MKSLIESLLDLARFDAGAEPIQRAPCDLADLARDCATLLRPLTEAKRLRLDLDLQPAPCHGDAARLTQVLTNLLTNAIHFTPADGTITLRTRQNGGARFSISDTGPGIAPDQLPHLFERFRRADASRARATGGTGLGLAICKAIVEAHGGSIAVESEIGKGSTFTVVLPRGAGGFAAGDRLPGQFTGAHRQVWHRALSGRAVLARPACGVPEEKP
jgi:signal transduction histidine kinase